MSLSFMAPLLGSRYYFQDAAVSSGGPGGAGPGATGEIDSARVFG